MQSKGGGSRYKQARDGEKQAQSNLCNERNINILKNTSKLATKKVD